MSGTIKVNDNLRWITEDICVIRNFQRPGMSTSNLLVVNLVPNESWHVAHVDFLFAADHKPWVFSVADSEANKV